MIRFCTIYPVFAAAVLLSLSACEKKTPEYRLKYEVGKEAVVHYDDMKDQPKFLKIKRSSYDKRKAIEERRVAREKARGIYRKESLWDF